MAAVGAWVLHDQPPPAPALQLNCSAGAAIRAVTGCMASRLPVTKRGNFLRNAGVFTAILKVVLHAGH
jgi:hypothetical protein